MSARDHAHDLARLVQLLSAHESDPLVRRALGALPDPDETLAWLRAQRRDVTPEPIRLVLSFEEPGAVYLGEADKLKVLPWGHARRPLGLEHAAVIFERHAAGTIAGLTCDRWNLSHQALYKSLARAAAWVEPHSPPLAQAILDITAHADGRVTFSPSRPVDIETRVFFASSQQRAAAPA